MKKDNQQSKSTSLGSKLFTVIFSGLLVPLMVFAFVFVALSPDFVSPNQNIQAGDEKDLIWYCNMDDLFDYFEEKGIMKKSERQLMSPIATENWICNNVDMMWWDVGNLAEGSREYGYWEDYKANEFMYFLFDEFIYSPRANGPFAVWASPSYPGNTDEFYEVFMAFPEEWSKYDTLSERVP